MIDYLCFLVHQNSIDEYRYYSEYNNSNLAEYYEYNRGIMEKAFENNMIILYNIIENRFVDINGNKIDITNKILFPRCPVFDQALLTDSIINNGGITIQNNNDCNIVYRWFDYINVDRNLKCLKYGDFKNDINKYLLEYGINNEIFLKTVKKKVSAVFKGVEETSGSMKMLDKDNYPLYRSGLCNGDEEILITKPLDITKDNYGNREWRAFIINDELQNISRCSDDKEVVVESYIQDFIVLKVADNKNKISSSYVMDIMEYNENSKIKLDIIEFNPIVAAGCYANNIDFKIFNGKTKKLIR